MLRKVYFELNPKAVGFSLGLILAICIFILGFIASLGYCAELVKFISQIYLQYEPNLKGSVIGALWAFSSAFFFGYFFSLVYNKLSEVE